MFEYGHQRSAAEVFLAHLSKAQDELLCSLAVRRRPSVRRPSTHKNDFSSETPGPIFFKLHMEPSVKGGLKICTNGHGPLITMAAMPIYSENTNKSSSSELRKLLGRILVYSIEH